VNGTDFKIEEPTPFNRKSKSPKAVGAAVRYEVGIYKHSGDIVWIYGPHRGGKHDVTIFLETLQLMLEENEMVETDAGYTGHKELIPNRNDYLSEAEKKEKSDLRARHETVNRRFK
jgi:hypothetical protein